MPRHCAMPSARLWRIPTIRVAARAIPAPPRVATSSSWSTTTARLNIGTSRVSSSATCAWTTIYLSVTLVRPAINHRPASCATCSIRRSIRFARWSRRSRSVAMPAPGWRSSRQFRASIWKARSTGGHTIGRSGAGIDSAPGKPSKPSARLNKLSGRGRPPHHPRSQTPLSVGLAAQPAKPHAAPDPMVPPLAAHVLRAQAAPALAARVQLVLTALAFGALDPPDLTGPPGVGLDPRAQPVQPNAGPAHRIQAALAGHLGRVQTGRRGARVDQPIPANLLSRSIERGGL